MITAAKPARQRRKAERSAEIVDVATALFAEQGFSATRLDEVARRAGVAKGTVYLYFDTKEDLFRAVARAALEAHVLPEKDSPPDAISLPALLYRDSLTMRPGYWQTGGLAASRGW